MAAKKAGKEGQLSFAFEQKAAKRGATAAKKAKTKARKKSKPKKTKPSEPGP